MKQWVLVSAGISLQKELRVIFVIGRSRAVGAHADSSAQGPRWQNPVTAVTDNSTANHQHQQRPGSHSAAASGTLHLSLLFKRAQHTIQQLWSSDVNGLYSGKQEHSDAVNQTPQLLHSPEQGGNVSTNQGPHNTSVSGNVTGNNLAAPDSSDLLHVMREAEELGFEAAVFSSNLSLGEAQGNTAAHGAAPSTTHPPTPAALGSVDDDHPSLNQPAMVANAHGTSPSLGLSLRGLGQAGNKSSSSRLQMPEQADEEDATSFAIDALEADTLTEKVVKAASAGGQDEQTDPAVCLSAVLLLVLLLLHWLLCSISAFQLPGPCYLPPMAISTAIA